MKHKVSELEGALLDAAVAKALGAAFRVNDGKCWILLMVPTFKTMASAGGTIKVPAGFDETLNVFCPSSDWSLGGPIIEREHIRLDWNSLFGWFAYPGIDMPIDCLPSMDPSASPLIAAMRSYVARKFGEEVEL